ncbi:hypothetical protein CDAR_602251 [Caerostris darwini]|uniref:Uncharacterized protein n=1 Tax=Caerostris darwini TaxID=1538125 RepID=A0AAV4N9I4_9ARAC|nr:hypothetical protein CDAR_602251 [Caerostris darwini]
MRHKCSGGGTLESAAVHLQWWLLTQMFCSKTFGETTRNVLAHNFYAVRLCVWLHQYDEWVQLDKGYLGINILKSILASGPIYRAKEEKVSYVSAVWKKEEGGRATKKKESIVGHSFLARFLPAFKNANGLFYDPKIKIIIGRNETQVLWWRQFSISCRSICSGAFLHKMPCSKTFGATTRNGRNEAQVLWWGQLSISCSPSAMVAPYTNALQQNVWSNNQKYMDPHNFMQSDCALGFINMMNGYN